MKTFKRVIYAVIVLILLVLVISFFLPSKMHTERSVVIKADKAVIYGLISNLNNWNLWTPWTKEMDSTVVFELKGPDGQVGTVRKWNGKIMGTGEMVINRLVPDEMIEYGLSFSKGKRTTQGSLTIEQAGDSCKVTWVDEGNLGNPINRYMGLFMKKRMKEDFDKCLEKLKKVSEERNTWPPIMEKVIPEQTALIIKDSAGPKTYSEVMGKGYGEIYSFIKANKLNITGPPFAIYLKWDSVTQFSVMNIGIPVEKAEKGKGRISIEKIPAFNAVVATYIGPYDKTASVYSALHQYCKEGEKVVTGGPWEIYVTDPMKEKDPMKLQTDIAFPVK